MYGVERFIKESIAETRKSWRKRVYFWMKLGELGGGRQRQNFDVIIVGAGAAEGSDLDLAAELDYPVGR